MQKKLTISINEEVYNALHSVIGSGRISRFLENLARPYVLKKNLENAYMDMANEEEREREAEDWSENLITDIQDETR